MPTLIKIEAGDPSVSVAAYATALWLIGKIDKLGEIADPAVDDVAMGQEVERMLR